MVVSIPISESVMLSDGFDGSCRSRLPKCFIKAILVPQRQVTFSQAFEDEYDIKSGFVDIFQNWFLTQRYENNSMPHDGIGISKIKIRFMK